MFFGVCFGVRVGLGGRIGGGGVVVFFGLFLGGGVVGLLY